MLFIVFLAIQLFSERVEGTYFNCAGPPENGDWVIETDITQPASVCNETIHLNGNLTLKSGVLTLSHTVIVMRENATKYNIVAENGTILNIGNCTIRGENSNATYGLIAMHSSFVTITNSNFSELGYIPAMNL
ncbi:MAG: hypothetical protein QXT63_03780, partial [Thermoplasmata archaeon]